MIAKAQGVDSVGPEPQGKLGELESLRGLLAVWVLAAHVAGRSLLDEEIRAAHLAAITEPLLPVYVFIILSGFVIFLVLNRERLSYSDFLIRRIFRLAPLYWVALAVVAVLVPFHLHVLESLPWRNRAVLDSIHVHTGTLQLFWPHLMAHILLLQGLLPDAWLPNANFTFLSPGWSVSLEWQFYVLAPGLLFLLKRGHFIPLVGLLIAFVTIQKFGFAGVGFLPNQFHYFLLGILSYYIFTEARRLPQVGGVAHDFILVVVCAAIYAALSTPWPVIIWIVVLDILVAARTNNWSWLTRQGRIVLEFELVQWLGKLSYSIYLIHIPVLYAVFHFLSRAAPELRSWGFLAVALPSTLAATILISAGTYRWIEEPCIRLGRRITKQ